MTRGDRVGQRWLLPALRVWPPVTVRSRGLWWPGNATLLFLTDMKIVSLTLSGRNGAIMGLREQLINAGFKERGNVVLCPYCQQGAKLVSGEKIYPHRKDLYTLKFWVCEPCWAYVGTHKDKDNKPLGTLADADLRKVRSYAHEAFDQKWRCGEMSRSDAYAWLSEALGVSVLKCHIGSFDRATCKKVIALCS